MGYPSAMSRYKARIDKELLEYFARLECPAALREAATYSLAAGGKRLKSVLLLVVHEMFKPAGPEALSLACAFEFIHPYSLIHDDLPAMDDDDFRRGRPSSHKKFGEAMAILAGDCLLTEAFAVAAAGLKTLKSDLALRAIHEMAWAAGACGMVGGQILDVRATGNGASREELTRIHNLKTGALFRAAVRCGAVIAGASEDETARLTIYAEKVGLAFQVADDVLDEAGLAKELGKTAGKDRRQEKVTYVRLLGLEESRVFAERLIREATAVLEPFGPRAEALKELAGFVIDRNN